MQETVLYKNEDILKIAEDELLISLTFLTSPDSVKSLIFLVAEARKRISVLYPKTIFYLLTYIEDEKRAPFYEMVISLTHLHRLKELCMKMELNSEGERVADIDVYLCRPGRKRYKISRKAT